MGFCCVLWLVTAGTRDITRLHMFMPISPSLARWSERVPHAIGIATPNWVRLLGRCYSTSPEVHWRSSMELRWGRSSLLWTPRAGNTTESNAAGRSTEHGQTTRRNPHSTVWYSDASSRTAAFNIVPADSHSQHTNCLCKYLSDGCSLPLPLFLSRSLSWFYLGYLYSSETLCLIWSTCLLVFTRIANTSKIYIELVENQHTNMYHRFTTLSICRFQVNHGFPYVEMAICTSEWWMDRTLIPIFKHSVVHRPMVQTGLLQSNSWTNMISHGLHRQHYSTFITDGRQHSSQISSDAALCHHIYHLRQYFSIIDQFF